MIIHFDVVIVGGGHGGTQTAASLRNLGFAGSIAIVTDETDLPYERPPLSKDYLSGRKELPQLYLRPERFWEENNISILTANRVEHVDPGRQQILTSSGAVIEYNHLVWSAGGNARKLMCGGCDLDGIHAIRNRLDVDSLKRELLSSQNIAIIGAGYIGLETAAVLTNLDKRVTVIEAQDRVLPRTAGRIVSNFLETEHRSHNVDIHLKTVVEHIEGKDGRVESLSLSGGKELAVDVAIVGIGIIPNVEPLLIAGALGDGGITVDQTCRTSISNIFAVGDCAVQQSRFANGELIRLESVQNAKDMAMIVAKSICGHMIPSRTAPRFWSTQYDIRLQSIGLNIGADEEIYVGSFADRSFSVSYAKGGDIIAVDCINDTKAFAEAQQFFR